MATITIETSDAHPTNYGRRGVGPIDTVIIHTTEASLSSAVSWFALDHKAFGRDPTSAHYVVGKDGRIVQCVPEDRTAFHAGNFQVNLRSIGIEAEGHCADPATWTPELIDALVELCAGIVARHGVPVQRTSGGPGFAGHADVPNPRDPTKRGGIAGNVDPGSYFMWPEFLDRLQARLASEVA
jgi:N-acetyl-anhydromuramyl-L-alanine amidase AmpD